MEAVAIQVKKQARRRPASPGSSAVSPPGPETPAGAIRREVTVTGTITAVDRKAQTATIKGPQGHE